MNLGSFLELVSNPTIMKIQEQDGKVIWNGFRGNFMHCENQKELVQREVCKFSVKCNSKRRINNEDLGEISELNSGKYNFCDIHLELVYVFTIK